MRIRLNEDRELVKEIDKGLNDNLEKYGKRYCPCSLEKNDNTICPCKEFRDSKELGLCHCGKYEKVEL